MRLLSIFLVTVLCACALAAAESRSINIGDKEYIIPLPKRAKFRQDFHDERHALRSGGKSPFVHDYSFVRSTPHTHVTYSYYHISHMASIPGVDTISFPLFRVFVKEIKDTLGDSEAREKFIDETYRKFVEKYPDEAVDIEASNIKDAGVYYGNAVVFSAPGERRIESSLYFFHDDVIFRLSIDDFDSRDKADSFAMLEQWMFAFLKANK